MMSSIPMAVSLSDILEVRGEPLREREVWALLCQTAAAIQDFFIKGASGKKSSTVFVINPTTLTVCRDGQVNLTPGESTWLGSVFMPPECCSESAHTLSDTATEKIFLYTLGKTLQVAAEYGLCKNEYVCVSHHLDSLLEAMCENNPAVRMGLRSVLEACDLHTRQHPEKTPYAQTICDLYSSVLGSVTQTRVKRSHTSVDSEERTLLSRFLRRPRYPQHFCDEQDNFARSSHARSRSRSPPHSRTQATQDSKDDSSSLPRTETCPVTAQTPPTSSSGGTVPKTTASHQDLNMSFASSAGDHASYHSSPAYQAYSGMPGLSLDAGNPAYAKYLQLKQRRLRLKTAKVGHQAGTQAAGYEGLPAAYPYPLPAGSLLGELTDYLGDSQSLASLMSTPGNCVPDQVLLDPHLSVPMFHGDLDCGSMKSTDLSLLMPVTQLKQQNLLEEQKQTHTLPGSPECIQKDEDQLSSQRSSSNKPLMQEQSVSSHKSDTQQPLQHMHQFDSQDLTPTPDVLPVKEYYGPEFVHRASLPVIRIPLPLQGESVKNAALARRIMVVYLTGQKYEVIVDPCMTGRQLFDAVVTHAGLDDFSFFGLTYVCEGEHFFLDADTKLYKMAPEGWREGAKGHMPPVTFNVYLRVKFYPYSLADFRHQSSYHLLYLQLRRDLLEERCMTDDQQLLALSGLALQADFGDYSGHSMAHNYFVPEQYLPPRAARRLGMGYVHDQALEAHRDALGVPPSQCEILFIKMVQKLPEYGIHFYRLMKGKHDSSDLVWMGITQTSLLVAEKSGSRRSVLQALAWPTILKISFNKRRFSVQPKLDPATHKGKPPKISFFTDSHHKGQYLLQFSTAQHRFHIRMRTCAAAMDHTQAGAVESLEAKAACEVERRQPKASVERQPSVVEKMTDRGVSEKGEEDKDQGQPMVSQPAIASAAAKRVPVASSEKHLDTTENDSEEPEGREVPPAKYRSPPSYQLSLDRLMEELSAENSGHAEGRYSGNAASSEKNASVNSVIVHGQEQMTTLHDGVASPLAVQSSSPQHKEQIASDLCPHHHDHHHHHRPASHLASGQSPLGRQITEVTVQKEGHTGIGLTIVGGETTSSLDLGIFVKSVLKDGPAARTGQIQAGDRLIAINGVSLEGVQHHEAVQLIRQSEQEVHLLLSQMHPPTSINDNDAVCCYQDDLKTNSCFLSDQSENTPPVFNTDSSRLFAFPSHPGPGSLDLTDSGTKELGKCPVTGLPGLDSSTVNAGAEDDDFDTQLFAATDLDSQDCDPGNKLETESDKEIQELHILGEIINVTMNNSDTDSDFESAVQATVEGKVHKSSSFKASQNGSPPWKSASISSPDMVVYEVLLEKEQGTLGIVFYQEAADSSLCVQSLVPGGPAEAGGILQQGDCLLELNGQSMLGVSSSGFEKALLSAPDACLMKIGRTKSMDDAAQAKLPCQLNKGPVPSDKRPCAPDVSVDHAAPWNDLAGPECQISPPAAFASMATSPKKHIPSALVIPPLFDVPGGEDDHSNNTQSDVDSDVLDSSRSELELAYRSAENYLKDNSEDFEIDDIVELEHMNTGVHKSVHELDYGNVECMTSGVNKSVVEAQRNAHTPGEEHSHDSFQDGSCGVTATMSSATPLVSSASPADKVGCAPHLVGTPLVGHSAHHGIEATDTLKKRNASVAFAETSNISQVEEMTVKLTKSAGGGLGFTVVGGVSTTGGCYIKAVLQDPALGDGRLRAGDRLIQVNGNDMTGLSHFEAVTFLRQTGKKVSIKIHRCQGSSEPVLVSPHQARENGPPSHPKKACPVEPEENFSERPVDCPPVCAEDRGGDTPQDCAEDRRGDAPQAVIRPYPCGPHSTSQHVERTCSPQLDHTISQTNAGVMHIVLDKSELRDSLGFSLIQQPTQRGQAGIFIRRLTPGGIAQTDGQLRAGDQLIQVNGESLIGSSHTKAVQLLRKASGSVVLTIFRHSDEHFEHSNGKIFSRDTSHLSIEGPADDGHCDVLDEAAELFSHEVGDIPKTKQTGNMKPVPTMHSETRDLRTCDQVQLNMPSTIGQTGLHMQSCSQTNCNASNCSLLPSHGEVTVLSGTASETHEEPAKKAVTERGYVRKVSSLEMPHEPTTDFLLSLPVLRMRTGMEERTVHLLERLADSVEQEVPLLDFEKLRLMKATDNMEVAKRPENKSRNRYRNVLPYDYNRVKLRMGCAESSDYINASYVQMSVKDQEDPLRYIVCQGPLLVTQDHFWQMVWEEGVSVLIMLTQEVESGKVKCHRYWPHMPGQPLDLCSGNYSICLEKEEKLGDFDIRQLTIGNRRSGEKRRVNQLHYTTWPDHGVPDSAYPLLQFSQLMHQLHQSGPFVVHCSAGIGRSGVLIAVDTALARIETGDELDLFDIVSELRHQRYGMIQTQDQYLFCYTACMEALLSKDQ